uniref:Uncharacterized protein n=2 Tax=Avena sativa TaxID=4498 RepID=A0ACD6A7D7_AVESA
MDKNKNPFHTSILLSVLLLVCFASHAQCRAIEGMKSNKINLPNGLCARRSCLEIPVCFCCLVETRCYRAVEDCIVDCRQSSALDTSAAMSRAMLPSHVT